MRVLMICKDSELGGTFRSCVELSEALADRGLDVSILAPEVAGPTIEVTRCEVIRPRSLGRALSTELSPGLAWSALRAKADVAHLHLPCPIPVPALLARTDIPLVVTYHCDLDRRFGGLAAVYEALTRLLLERATAVLISTDALRRSPVLRGVAARCEIVPLGVDPRRLALGPSGAAQTARLRERHGAFVLFVGRLAYYKGIDVLVDAMAMLPDDAKLVVVGEGTERSRIEAAIGARGIASRVTLVGYVPDSDLAPYLHAAQLLVLPSTSHAEAFGLVLVEAALAGLPVISTALSTGTSWVNRDGESGLIVPPRDPAALAAAMASLLANEPLRRSMGERGRRRALDELTAARAAAAVHGIYDRIFSRATKS